MRCGKTGEAEELINSNEPFPKELRQAESATLASEASTRSTEPFVHREGKRELPAEIVPVRSGLRKNIASPTPGVFHTSCY